jgi:histidine triad (HIT) family protein
MACIFCDIIAHKRPARIFFEDDSTIVFADIFPRAPVHLLVSPKRHWTSLQELPQEAILDLMARVKAVASELSIENNFKLILHNGAKAGQIVEHIHFHFLSNASVNPAFKS